MNHRQVNFHPACHGARTSNRSPILTDSVRPMIGIRRPPPPMVLSDRRIAELEQAAGEFFMTETRSARPRTFEFVWPNDRIETGVLDALKLAWTGCCAFCGAPASARGLDIHRFRPTKDAVASNGDT